jgi:tetraacyldisaccharide 4'-kinase
MIENLGATLDKMAFPDHHSFTEYESMQIVERFLSIQKEHKYIITTEKDAMRLRSHKTARFFSNLPVYYIPIAVTFLNRGEEGFRKRVETYLAGLE